MKSDEHNLLSQATDNKPFGIEFKLKDEDTFSLVLGTGWKSYRWYSSAEKRNKAFQELKREHEYSRIGDGPSVVIKTIEK
jgi:hypothetical protein